VCEIVPLVFMKLVLWSCPVVYYISHRYSYLHSLRSTEAYALFQLKSHPHPRIGAGIKCESANSATCKMRKFYAKLGLKCEIEKFEK